MESQSWNDTQKLLAFLVVVAFIIIILIWMFHPPSPDAATTSVLNTLVGTLGGFAASVVGYFFGTSRSSASKDQTIQALAAAPAPVPALAREVLLSPAVPAAVVEPAAH